MAISVRLPSGKGPYIEHYLIQGSEDGHIGLESSENKFNSIPLLIAHYCQCWWVPEAENNLLRIPAMTNAAIKRIRLQILLNFILSRVFFFSRSDELPVQLTLPRAIRDAKNRQQLTSLALLGQGRCYPLCVFKWYVDSCVSYAIAVVFCMRYRVLCSM